MSKIVEVDFVKGAPILDEVRDYLRRFVSYPSPEALDAHTLWCAHTHAMEAWHITPRLAFLSPEPECGKTRALDVTELLVPRPVAAFDMSPAALYTIINAGGDEPPTVLYDEVDCVFLGTPSSENVRAILNQGYMRGKKVHRATMVDKARGVEEMNIYAAVVMAGIGRIPDTLFSRSVVIQMKRRGPNEHVESFRHRNNAPEGEELGKRLGLWAKGKIVELAEARPKMPPGVDDRAADCWEALLAIAEAAGGHWPATARQAATELVKVSKLSKVRLPIRLLADLSEIWPGDMPNMFTVDIIEALHKKEGSPWKHLKHGPLTDALMASMLRDYHVFPKVVRIGERTLHGYVRAQAADAWTRYARKDDEDEAPETPKAANE